MWITLKVDRLDIFDCMIKHLKSNLVRELYIDFIGEKGVDASGLRRQFYDIIGDNIKNGTLFKSVMSGGRSCYTFHPEFHKIKNYKLKMEALGKFIANAILNQELIGADFSDTFVKALFEQEMVLSDLKEILPEKDYKNYEMLQTYSDDDFEALMLTFTAEDNGKSVPLMENGENIPLTRANFQQYLSLLANLKLVKRFQQPITCFLRGFNSVFPFNVKPIDNVDCEEVVDAE